MRELVLALIGGGMGTVARFLVQTGMTRLLGPAFPWGTFAINITGSFLMGLVATMIATRFQQSPHAAEIRTFLATGILGGYTTFSAFSLDASRLMDSNQSAAAAFYIAGSVGFSILALYMGFMVAKAIWA